MAIVALSLDTIRQLDNGRVFEAFSQALSRAVRDCEDRPGEDKARKVVLQIELTPVVQEEHVPTTVALLCQVKDTVPTRKSRPYSCGIRAGGVVAFSTESPTQFNQMTLGLVGSDE